CERPLCGHRHHQRAHHYTGIRSRGSRGRNVRRSTGRRPHDTFTRYTLAQETYCASAGNLGATNRREMMKDEGRRTKDEGRRETRKPEKSWRPLAGLGVLAAKNDDCPSSIVY